MNDKISRRNARKSGATLIDFVLVHGTWGGGWQWRAVAERLRARGHRVFTPTLTGLGERAHLVRRDTGLDTHIADIVNVIAWEDLTRVALVGTSAVTKPAWGSGRLAPRSPRPMGANASSYEGRTVFEPAVNCSV